MKEASKTKSMVTAFNGFPIDREQIAVNVLNGILGSLSHPVAQQMYQRQSDKLGITTQQAHVKAAFAYADLILAERKGVAGVADR